MRTLTLIRHAETVQKNNFIDEIRSLTDYGVQQAINLGHYLNKNYLKIDFILCSSALRAKQTAENLLTILSSKPPIEYTKQLYYTSDTQILEQIQMVDNKFQNVAIISHNPNISELAFKLANEENKNQLDYFSTAELVRYEFNIENWHDLSLGQGQILCITKG